METANHHVLHRLGQLSPDRVDHLRFDGRVGRHQPAKEPPVGAAEVEDPRRLGAVVSQQMVDAHRGNAELQPALPELAQIRRLTAGQWLLIGAGLRVAWSAVTMPQLPHGFVHHLRGHGPVGRKLASDHRQHPARAVTMACSRDRLEVIWRSRSSSNGRSPAQVARTSSTLSRALGNRALAERSRYTMSSSGDRQVIRRARRCRCRWCRCRRGRPRGARTSPGHLSGW